MLAHDETEDAKCNHNPHPLAVKLLQDPFLFVRFLRYWIPNVNCNHNSALHLWGASCDAFTALGSKPAENQHDTIRILLLRSERIAATERWGAMNLSAKRGIDSWSEIFASRPHRRSQLTCIDSDTLPKQGMAIPQNGVHDAELLWQRQRNRIRSNGVRALCCRRTGIDPMESSEKKDNRYFTHEFGAGPIGSFKVAILDVVTLNGQSEYRPKML